MTLEQIVNEIKTFGANHDQIKSVFEGELKDSNLGKGDLYPRLMFELIPSTIDLGQEFFSFRVGCFDRVMTDQSNRLNVLSDCRQILTDFCGYFKNNPSLNALFLQLPVTLTDYVEYKADGVAGYFMDVNFKQYQGLNYCGIPVNGAPINPNSVKIIDQDGNILEQLHPGQQYTVEVLRRIIETITSNEATIIEPLN